MLLLLLLLLVVFRFLWTPKTKRKKALSLYMLVVFFDFFSFISFFNAAVVTYFCSRAFFLNIQTSSGQQWTCVVNWIHNKTYILPADVVWVMIFIFIQMFIVCKLNHLSFHSASTNFLDTGWRNYFFLNNYWKSIIKNIY